MEHDTPKPTTNEPEQTPPLHTKSTPRDSVIEPSPPGTPASSPGPTRGSLRSLTRSFSLNMLSSLTFPTNTPPTRSNSTPQPIQPPIPDEDFSAYTQKLEHAQNKIEHLLLQIRGAKAIIVSEHQLPDVAAKIRDAERKAVEAGYRVDNAVCAAEVAKKKSEARRGGAEHLEFAGKELDMAVGVAIETNEVVVSLVQELGGDGQGGNAQRAWDKGLFGSL